MGDRERWHLEKTISISHIMTTIGLIAAALSAYYSLGSRVTLTEDRLMILLENQARVDDAQDESLEHFRAQMRDSTIEINNKLDMVLQELLSDD